MLPHPAPELHPTVGASIWGPLRAPLLTEKSKPRVTVGRKATDHCPVGQRWPGCRGALLMRTRRDRDRTNRRSGVTEIGIVVLVVFIGFLAGWVLPGTNFAQVAP